MSVDVIHSPVLASMPHGFLGRSGGVSTGAIEGLNVGYGSGDDRDSIAENRRRAIEAVLPHAQLATVHQVHSADVVYVEHAWPQDDRPHADAMVTDRPNVLLGILTADCAPVLFADPDGCVVGAAHAGWRGAIAGVTHATIEAMEQLGAKRDRISAAVGPCIGQASYEVDDGFRDRFIHADPNHARFFLPGPSSKPHFDLEGFVVAQLILAGLQSVAALGLDTYAAEGRFFSYRRATHRGEADYGRQVSLIGLPT